MKADDHVELVIDAAWFTKFYWSRQLINPDLGHPPNSRAFAVHCVLLDPGHHAGLIVKTDSTWDARGNRHPGMEIVVPWPYVVGVLKIDDEEQATRRRVGFMPRKPSKGR